MKRISLLVFAITVSAITCNAQFNDSTTNHNIDLEEQKAQCFQEAFVNNGFGFGFQLNQYQNDFGLGLNVSSPFFAFERMAIRLRGNLMFNEHLSGTTMAMTPYTNVTLGLVGASGKVGNYIRIYGEGGMIGIFPSPQFSSEKFVRGGYGLLGVDFFTSRFTDYFLEFGMVGTGAKEDKIATKPIYSNGFIISTGFRFCLE